MMATSVSASKPIKVTGADVIDCGTGRDTVYADRRDKVAKNCEIVHRG